MNVKTTALLKSADTLRTAQTNSKQEKRLHPSGSEGALAGRSKSSKGGTGSKAHVKPLYASANTTQDNNQPDNRYNVGSCTTIECYA